MSGVRLAAIALGGAAGPWRDLGFTVDENGWLPLANGAVTFGTEAAALVVESGAELPGDVDGVPIRTGAVIDGLDHANGAFEIDHVVVMTDSLDRTSAAIEAGLGLGQRRIRETPTVRQAFHRFADQGGVRGCIIEVVENPRVERPGVWGLVVNVADLETFAAMAGDLVGRPKPAVQAGRSIATVRREAGLGTAVAVMSTSAA